jgi:hypothetical protein
VLFDAPALDAADFDAAVFAAEVLAGVRLACADFAGVRTAVVFFAADAPVVRVDVFWTAGASVASPFSF